eukprot:3741884-Prymnesium_polylepis.1
MRRPAPSAAALSSATVASQAGSPPGWSPSAGSSASSMACSPDPQRVRSVSCPYARRATRRELARLEVCRRRRMSHRRRASCRHRYRSRSYPAAVERTVAKGQSSRQRAPDALCFAVCRLTDLRATCGAREIRTPAAVVAMAAVNFGRLRLKADGTDLAPLLRAALEYDPDGSFHVVRNVANVLGLSANTIRQAANAVRCGVHIRRGIQPSGLSRSDFRYSSEYFILFVKVAEVPTEECIAWCCQRDVDALTVLQILSSALAAGRTAFDEEVENAPVETRDAIRAEVALARTTSLRNEFIPVAPIAISAQATRTWLGPRASRQRPLATVAEGEAIENEPPQGRNRRQPPACHHKKPLQQPVAGGGNALHRQHQGDARQSLARKGAQPPHQHAAP